MLEKNKNIFYFDAHFHLADCLDLNRDSRVKPGNDTSSDLSLSAPPMSLSAHQVSLSGLTRQSFLEKNWIGCSCFHSIEEWEIGEKFLEGEVLRPFRQAQGPQFAQGSRLAQGPQIILSYGLHPQSAGHIDIKTNADFLEQLLKKNKLHAIGEAGFDYFNQDFREQAATQEEMFNIQLDLALKYNLPLVIHCRKANEKLFEYSKQLKKLPAVLFHSFMGTPIEAKSLLNRGINGFFSFGKQVMNNNKKVIACVRDLPADVLLTETDAPWQFLKGESHTNPLEIKKIFEAFCQIRNEAPEILAQQLKQNFLTLFFQNSNTKS